MPILPQVSVRPLIRLTITISLLLLLTTSLWAQTTIRVPEDQPTIQNAINVASNGDTVLVAPGTYFENLFFGGKAITVKSSAGADSTVIDGGGLPITSFQLGEGQSSVLDGFTTRNGGTDGAIVVFFSSPTITNNIIRDNAGCGIHLSFSPSAVVANNTISNNLTGCPAQDGGAGITIDGSGSPLITGNTIINNGSDTNFLNGGGIGVGSFSGDASPVIRNNTIKNNRAPIGGGIMLGFGANAVITQNLIVENTADLGGGVAISGALGSLTSNTIANNDGLSEGSGIFLDNFISPLSLIDNLIVGRAGNTVFFCNTFSPALILTNNDAFAPAGPAYGGACPDATGANGNISVDPLFVDPSQSDYELQSASAAIDQGSNAAPNLLQQDFVGQSRMVDGNSDGVAVIDMGAYEFTLVKFSPQGVAFGRQVLGTTSASRLVTVTNRSSMTFRPFVALTGDIQDFQENDDCFSELSPGATCTLNFTFTPHLLGARAATFTVSRFDGQVQQPLAVLPLSGEGVLAPPSPIELTLSPSSLDFPAQLVGTTSELQRVFLDAPAAFEVNGITVTGPFQQLLVGCTHAASFPCHIEVTFTPTQRGPATGVLTIHSNAVGSPHTVPLSGIGRAPAATVSPTALDFGTQAVGSTSSRELTLTNNGNATLHISAISTTGEFGHTDNCFGVLAAGQSCIINATFTPSATGQRGGTLTIASDSEDTVPTVTLTGRGAVPVAAVNPASLSFADQRVGTTSAVQSVTLSNTGEVALHIREIFVLGEFAQTNDCGALLAPGAACHIAVTFIPATAGFRNGSVVISNNDPGAPPIVEVPLSGTGVIPVASVSPAALAFGARVLNTSSEAKAVILSNDGGAPLQLFSISAAGDFAQSNNCGTQVAPHTGCVINVMFNPSVTGPRAGTLTISSDGSEVPLVVSLSGTGVTNAPTLNPGSIVFRNTKLGRTSMAKTVLLTANGPGPLEIFAITVSGDFSQANDCPSSLTAGMSCTISVQFTPTVEGEITGALSVVDNGLGGPHSVFLSGSGKDVGKP